MDQIGIFHQPDDLCFQALGEECRPFEFNVEHQTRAKFVQHLGQGGDTLSRECSRVPTPRIQLLYLGQGEVFDLAAAVCGCVYCEVMDDDYLTVLAELHVKFNAVSTHFGCQTKGGHGVFGCCVAGAPVRQIQGSARMALVSGVHK